MKKSLKIMMLASVAIFLNSCVSFVKPGMEKVKKIAVISIESNKALYGVNLQGNRFSSITGAATMIEGQQGGGNPFIAALLAKANERFSKEISMLGNYQVVSGAEVTGNPAYLEFTKNLYSGFGGDVVKGLQKINSQQLTGYEMIPEAEKFMQTQKNSAARAALADLASKLGVDAVALIDVDFHYQVTAELLGSGSADAAVKTVVFVVNKDGEEAISGWIPEERAGVLGMVAGNVFLNKDTQPIFEKAVTKSFEKMGEMAAKDLKKKS